MPSQAKLRQEQLSSAIQESGLDAAIVELVAMAADAKISPLDLVLKIAHTVDPSLKGSTQKDHLEKCIAALKLHSVKFKLANLGSDKVLDISHDTSESST